jgi:hypothetical protein
LTSYLPRSRSISQTSWPKPAKTSQEISLPRWRDRPGAQDGSSIQWPPGTGDRSRPSRMDGVLPAPPPRGLCRRP